MSLPKLTLVFFLDHSTRLCQSVSDRSRSFNVSFKSKVVCGMQFHFGSSCVFCILQEVCFFTMFLSLCCVICLTCEIYILYTTEINVSSSCQLFNTVRNLLKVTPHNTHQFFSETFQGSTLAINIRLFNVSF